MSALFGLDMSPLLITLSEYDRQGTPGEMGVPTRLRFGNTHPDYNVSARAFLLSRRARKAIRRFMNRNAAAAGALRGDIRMLTTGADDQRGGTTRHVHGRGGDKRGNRESVNTALCLMYHRDDIGLSKLPLEVSLLRGRTLLRLAERTPVRTSPVPFVPFRRRPSLARPLPSAPARLLASWLKASPGTSNLTGRCNDYAPAQSVERPCFFEVRCLPGWRLPTTEQREQGRDRGRLLGFQHLSGMR